MSWLCRWRRAIAAGGKERRALKAWVRLRFQLAASDPMITIIGGAARLTEAGMTTEEAVDTVLRIMLEFEAPARPD